MELLCCNIQIISSDERDLRIVVTTLNDMPVEAVHDMYRLLISDLQQKLVNDAPVPEPMA